MAKPKIKYKQQDRTVLAITCFGHGGTSIAWSSGKEPNIIHATRAVRKAKRDNKIYGWQIMTAHIFDISDCENWAWDGYQLVNPDIVDKNSRSYKEDYFNQWKGCKPFKLIESLEVVT
tara:strand:- start:305 stop:658 length:354 start_codon:yes stop_codon:yes gene_type:complete